MKHLALVPLIGGMAIGAEKVLGGPPEAVLSYSAFAGNDQFYMKYLAQRGLDIKRYEIDDVEIPTFSDIDIVTSVCPCAGLSSVTTRAAGAAAGCQQNEWMKLSTRHALRTIRPRVLIGENAPALATKTGQPVAQILKEIGKEFGYSMQLVKTSTHLHGIPQRRVRSFFILYRDGGPFEIQWSHNEYEGTWTEYLDSFEVKEETSFKPSARHQELWELGRKVKAMGEAEYTTFMHNTKQSTLQVILEEHPVIDSFLAEHLDGEDETKAKLAYDIVRCRNKTAQGKRFWDGSVVMTKQKNYNSVMWRTIQWMWRHDLKRPISPREQMRLMGLPENFEVPRANLNAICQNVPICTASWIVSESIAALNGERELWDGEGSPDGILRQNNINMKYMKL